MCEGDGMEEWKECRLTEIMDLIGGGTPKTSNPDYWDGDIPWISVKDFNGERRYVGDTEKKITKLGLENSSTKILSKGDIIISARGTVGELAIIPSDMAFNQSCYGLRAKDFVDSCFLYYLLKQSVNILKHNTHGSVFDTITRETFENISVKLPPLPTQQKISRILSSLDDKIELNNKINTNLERQAGALFKNWFVDFEPFGGKMPEGWRVGKLSEYCNFQEGYVNPAQTHNEYFDGDVKWLRTVDINESFILNTSRTLTKCGFESAGKSAFLFKPGSIAISKSGTVGRLGIISDFMCGNRAVIGIELKEQQNLSYIHQYLKSRQTEFPDMAVGSVQKNLYVSILENLDIIIPSKEVLEKFAAICIPFYDQIKTNCVENNNLSSIRDTLLPKLMNGEIETNSNIISKR